MTTVLVTGANGFIGRHLCGWLSRRGFTVIAGVRGAVPQELEGYVEERRIADLAQPDVMQAACSGVDAVVHLAARVHVMQDTADDPLAQYKRVNTDATLSMGRSAARSGVSRFIFLSTVKVNGERTTTAPFTDHDVPAPADPYAQSKWEAERGLAEISRATGLDVVTLRPPLVYGPGVKGNFLRLLRLLRARVPMPLASVDNFRSMIYVGNLASAIERTLSVKPAVRDTFLVSDGSDLSTPQLLRMTGAALGCPARLFALPPSILATLGRTLGKGAEVARMIESLRVDCSRIQKQLQWAAPFTPEQGIKETAEWFIRTRPVA